MKPKIKKVLKIVLIVLIILVIAYALLIGFLLTNGYRDNVSFCTKFQSLIEEHKVQTGKYPNSLKELGKSVYSFNHNAKSCGYSSQNGEYEFFTKVGLMGVAYYNSKSGKWTYD